MSERITIDPEKLKDNPFQPRSHYPTKTIEEIAYSIEQVGIIHVPTGRHVNGHYELAEGHLRKRAWIKLKKKDPKKWGEMPLDVREFTDNEMAVIALEENLRRQDITPLEQARAIDIYLNHFTDVTEVALAKTLNMTQGNISNMRRVLKCPEEILQKIVDGKINFTMARELLVFQGLNAGYTTDYRKGKEIQIPKDEKWLMLEAIHGITAQYGRPSTVDGIKKCIFDVAERQFKWLDKQDGYWGRDHNPLFDTRAAGCLKCDKMIRANETKSKVRHFCTDEECWNKKQEEHVAKQAVKAKEKMEADIAERIAAELVPGSTEEQQEVDQERASQAPATIPTARQQVKRDSANDTWALNSFVRIKTPDDILQFARRYGPLGLCRHGRPPMHRVRNGERKWCAPCGNEPVKRWLDYAALASSYLNLAAILKVDTGKRMRGLRQLFLQDGVNEWLGDAGIRLELNWSDNEPSLTLTGGAVFGALGVQLLSAVTANNLAVCSGCGIPYLRKGRKPQAGRRNFCPDCGDKVANKLRVRRSRTLKQKGGTQ